MAAALRDGPRIVPEGAGQIGGDAAEALAQRSAPPDKNVIMTGPALPGSKQAHGFPQAPANAVALHGFLGNTLGYREAEAGRAIIIAPARFQKERAATGLAAFRGEEEIASLLQPREGRPAAGHADRRLRPLARRRARTLRPSWVAIRARKP